MYPSLSISLTPWWALGAWCSLGAIHPQQQAGGAGCGLTVVQDRLLATGGYREDRAQFSRNSLVWRGTFDAVARQISRIQRLDIVTGATSAASCNHPFVTVPDLAMVTPMHAHTVFAMPLLSADSGPELTNKFKK